MPEVRTTCPYCGVGCGIVATVNATGAVEIAGDPSHPANFGRLCSKGAALGETVDLEGRLLFPQVGQRQVGWDEALQVVASTFGRVVAEHGPDALAFYISGQLLTEDYYVVNKFAKGFLGTANVDTNSRLCMASAVAAHKRAFGSDTVPVCYEDLERAKLIVIAGANSAWCHPVLFQRIVQARRDHPDLQVVVIDPRRTATCDIADQHLPLRPGSDAMLFNGLLHYIAQHDEINHAFVEQCTEGLDEALQAARRSAPTIAKVAEYCLLEPEDVARFYRLFARTERVVTVFSQGINQSTSGSDKGNAIINCHLATGRIGRPGAGPFSVTGQPNAMGGREVGGLANQLAAHMELERPDHRRRVQAFWGSPTVAQRPGLKAVELFKAVAAGQVKALWIMGTNPAVSLPDVSQVREALAACPFVVVSDCMADTDTMRYAQVRLPALAWGEKSGMVTNSERRISRQRAFLPSPGQARPDWWAVCEVARRMGFAAAFSYRNAAEIFREHAALSGYENEGERDFDLSAVAQISDQDYDQWQPRQWPLNAAQPQGTARMFTRGRFFTPTGKAQFIAVTPRSPAVETDESFPLILNTGRVRDQWHTMTRTGKAARLNEHEPEPFAQIHPQDAARYGKITGGDLVRLFSRWGEILVRAHVDEQQRPGSVFVPFHWNDTNSLRAVVGSVINDAVDPVSGQPEFKQTPVRIEPYRAGWHGFVLSRRRLPRFDSVTYWTEARGNGFYRYEIAGDEPAQDWPGWARGWLCAPQDDVHWVEYLDVKARRYRAVRLVDDRIDSCLFIGPAQALPPRHWLAGLFQVETLSDRERMNLLTGRAPQGVSEVGATVCACFGVGVNRIMEAIRQQGLTSVEEIGQALKAGTNCGSCIPELKNLLAQCRNERPRASSG